MVDGMAVEVLAKTVETEARELCELDVENVVETVRLLVEAVAELIKLDDEVKADESEDVGPASDVGEVDDGRVFNVVLADDERLEDGRVEELELEGGALDRLDVLDNSAVLVEGKVEDDVEVVTTDDKDVRASEFEVVDKKVELCGIDEEVDERVGTPVAPR